MTDPTEDIRKRDTCRDQRCPRHQGVPGSQARTGLGHTELAHDFIVIGFSAPLVVVNRQVRQPKGQPDVPGTAPGSTSASSRIEGDTPDGVGRTPAPIIQTGGKCNVSLFSEMARPDPGKTGVPESQISATCRL